MQKQLKTVHLLCGPLLFLFAGTAASSELIGEPVKDVDLDWHEAQLMIEEHYGPQDFRPISCLSDHQINTDIQMAQKMSGRVVRDPDIHSAIQDVAQILLDVQPTQDGMSIVLAPEILDVCETRCGASMQQTHPAVNWIDAGTDQ